MLDTRQTCYCYYPHHQDAGATSDPSWQHQALGAASFLILLSPESRRRKGGGDTVKLGPNETLSFPQGLLPRKPRFKLEARRRERETAHPPHAA